MDLRSAAEQLNVHYQTAYRWVREGRLPAVKIGASYDVSIEDVERVAAERLQPAPPPAKARVRAWDQQAERLYDTLVAGDELGARQIVDRLHEGQIETVEICEQLIAPALRRVGDAWADGRIDVAQEHRAAAISGRLLARVAVHPRGRPRGVAVVTTVPGEQHALGAAMAAMALRADRWQVHHLGPQTPPKYLAAFAAREEADVVVLAVTYTGAQEESKRAAKLVRIESGARVLVGWPGASLRELLAMARPGGHARLVPALS